MTLHVTATVERWPVDGQFIIARGAKEYVDLLVVAVSDDARQSGVKAGALVKLGSAILGGGGGGKDDFAQGGGTDASKSLEALTAISNALIG